MAHILRILPFSMPDYICVASRDGDCVTLRVTLSKKKRVHSSLRSMFDVSATRLYVGRVVVGVASVQSNSRVSSAGFWYKDRGSLLRASHTEKELL